MYTLFASIMFSKYYTILKYKNKDCYMHRETVNIKKCTIFAS